MTTWAPFITAPLCFAFGILEALWFIMAMCQKKKDIKEISKHLGLFSIYFILLYFQMAYIRGLLIK